VQILGCLPQLVPGSDANESVPPSRSRFFSTNIPCPIGLELRQDSRHASARAISNFGMLIGLDYPDTGRPKPWVD
jgi:hypothetical protein